MDNISFAIYMAFIFTSLVSIYVFILRPIVVVHPSVRMLYEELNTKYASLWSRFRLRLSGVKTLVVSNLLIVAGVFIGIHDFVLPLVVDVSLDPFVPEKYQKLYPMAVSVIGILYRYLRSVTDTPPGVPSPQVVNEVLDQVVQKETENGHTPSQVSAIAEKAAEISVETTKASMAAGVTPSTVVAAGERMAEGGARV